MDYSKLSDQELIALKKGDYSQLSDQTLLALKGEAAPQQAPSMMDKVKSAAQFVNDTNLLTAIPNKMADLVQKGANVAGEKVTEAMGGSGIPVISNPNVAAGVGTAIQQAPNIAALAAGGIGAEKQQTGAVAKFLAGPSRAEAGTTMGNLERGVGLETDVVPSLKQMSTKLGLKQASTKDYITAVMKAAKDKSLSPQELLEHHKLITSLMENEPSALAKTLQGAKSPLGGTGGKAIASKADSLIVKQLNEAVPGRADQAANYAAAKMRNKAYTTAGGAALTYVGGPKLVELLKKVWGH